MNAKITMPENVKHIVNTIQNHNHKAYIVGGCVRDQLLGIVPHDWDICTSATPEEIKKIFKNNKIIDTGIKHGTVTLLINNDSYEITTFRADGNYSDQRHPDNIKFITNLEQDLARRDFTINAMAYNEQEGLIDPFNGQIDINYKFISCVNNPCERIKEDPLRILRALRFAVNYNFDIDNNTINAIKQYSYLIENISKERIRDEICKMLKSDINLRKLRNYTFILTTVIPELTQTIDFKQFNPYHDFDVYVHTIRAVKYCNTDDLITRLALLFHDIGKPDCYYDDDADIRHFKNHGYVSAEITDNIMRRLKFDNNTRKKTVQLVQYHDATIEPEEKNIKNWLNKMNEEQFRRLLDIRRADILAQKTETNPKRIEKINKIREMLDEILKNKECFSHKDLAINGFNIMEIKPELTKSGKEIGKILNDVLKLVINNKLENSRQTLLDYIKNI